MVEQPAADAQPQAAKKKKKSKKGGKRKQTDAQQAGLPAHLDLQRTHVICGPDVNYHVRASDRQLSGAPVCGLQDALAMRPVPHSAVEQATRMCFALDCCHVPVCTQRPVAHIHASLHGLGSPGGHARHAASHRAFHLCRSTRSRQRWHTCRWAMTTRGTLPSGRATSTSE